MVDQLQLFLQVFSIFFVALDSIGLLPLYISVTTQLKEEDQKSLLKKSFLVGFLVAVIFVFVGDGLFAYLGITLGDFKIAGGLILAIVGAREVLTSPTPGGGPSSITPGIVPLAVPLITGPAIISSVFIQAQTVGIAVTFFALLANYFLAFVLFWYSSYVVKVLNQDIITIVSKITSLFLVAMGLGMARSGLGQVLPLLLSSS